MYAKKVGTSDDTLQRDHKKKYSSKIKVYYWRYEINATWHKRLVPFISFSIGTQEIRVLKVYMVERKDWKNILTT